MKYLILVCSILLLVPVAGAEQLTDRDDLCTNRELATTEYAQYACAYSKYNEAALQKITVYHQLAKRLGYDSVATSRLAKSEEDWQNYRDTECQRISRASSSPLEDFTCRTQITNERTRYLKSMMGP